MAFQIHEINLKPFTDEGTLHVTHRLKETKSGLQLTPSMFNTSLYIGCALLGYALLISAIYFIFVIGDLTAAFGLSVGGGSLYLISKRSAKDRKSYQFNGSQKVLYGLDQPIPFNDIQQIELLKKTIHSSPDAPFQSGEICVLTNTGKRFLLTQGAESIKMKEIALSIAQYVDTSLMIDKTINLV